MRRLALAIGLAFFGAGCSAPTGEALGDCSAPPPQCAQGVAGQRCSDVIVPATCQGGQWRCLGTGVIPASQCNGFGLPPPDTGLSGCRNEDDCAPGEVCLFWEPGCGRRGRCEARCPAVDLCGGCNLHCDCQGFTFEGCASRPFQSRGPCPDADAGPSG